MVAMREVCDELRQLSQGRDGRTRTILVSGFALQFAGLYRNFCQTNGQSERRAQHDRLVGHILGGRRITGQASGIRCEAFLFDTDAETDLIETDGAFEAALFAYYACADADHSGEATEEFVGFISGLNASRSLSRDEIESCFDYENLVARTDILNIMAPHLDLLRGGLSCRDYFSALRGSMLPTAIFISLRT